MKKLLLLALMCIVSVSTFALETSKCVLSHQGALTMYDGSAIADAINASVKGDTLFLTSGSFSGFTLNKEITVRGSGNGATKITGDITVSISGTPILTQTLLEGLSLENDYSVILSTAMDGVKIKQCNFYNLSVSANNYNLKLYRCKLNGNMNQSLYIKSFDAYNCKISTVNGRTETNISNFYNCNITTLKNADSGYLKGTFINCIISTSPSYYYGFGNCIFVNTLHGWNWNLLSTSTEQECYLDTNMTMSDMECGYSTETLTAKGYLGNDGTVVGIYGGSNPFTLKLPIPSVTSSKITLDTATKKLKATLSVVAN